jgi:hypothetical protein
MKSFKKKAQKGFCIKAFSDLGKVDRALDIISSNLGANMELSILGKLNHDEFNNKKILVEKRRVLRTYWRKRFKEETDIGFFSHPDIGDIYILGHLMPMFLYDVNGKKLGSLSGGTYGILRGLGIGPKETLNFLKILKEGSCLIILRGYELQLNRLEHALKLLDKSA